MNTFQRPRSLIATLIALTASMGLAGCASAQDGTATDGVSVSEPIVGGTVDSQDSQVVALLSPSNTLCTGIAISPTKVLTAAHCVDDRPNAVYRDLTVGSTSHAYAVLSAVRDPAYNGTLGDGHDLGLLTLSEALPGTPLPTNLYGDLPLGIHGSIRVVVGPNRPLERIAGFGRTSPTGPAGTRYAVGVDIAQYRAATLDLTGAASACFGDSGGPILWDTSGFNSFTVIGVASFGNSTCTTSSYNRVNVYASFIRALYADALGRGADSDGLHHHVDAMVGGGSMVTLAGNFIASVEYQNRENDLRSVAWLGHHADAPTLASWLNKPDRTVRVAILTSAEYLSRHNASSAAYIQSVFASVLGRAPNASEASGFGGVYASSGVSGVAQVVLDSDEAHRRQVSDLYVRYLHRAADSGGLNTWAHFISTGASIEAVGAAIAGSAENWSRALTAYP